MYREKQRINNTYYTVSINRRSQNFSFDRYMVASINDFFTSLKTIHTSLENRDNYQKFMQNIEKF